MSSSADVRSGTIAIRVRYNECDPMGVAHHTAYPIWFEIGRTELLRLAQPGLSYRDLESQGIFLAVVSLNVRYKRPARYDDLLSLRTAVTDVGHVKIEHAYELTDANGLMLATGSTVLACLDREGRPQMLPESLRRGGTGQA